MWTGAKIVNNPNMRTASLQTSAFGYAIYSPTWRAKSPNSPENVYFCTYTTE